MENELKLADKTKWVILLTVYIGIFSYTAVMFSIPTGLNQIMVDFDLSYAQAGLLMSMFVLPGIFITIPAGILSDRYGPRSIGIVALTSMIIGSLIVTLANGYPILIIGRLISGFGGVMLAVISPQTIAQWFKHKQLGLAMGIYQTGIPLGTIFTYNVLVLLNPLYGWRFSILISVILSVIALLIFLVFYKSVPRLPDNSLNAEPTTKISNINFLSIFKASKVSLAVWLLALSGGLFNLAFTPLFTFAPLFLLSNNLDLQQSGFITSLIMLYVPIVAPITGLLLDRIKHRELFVVVGGIIMFVAMILMPFNDNYFIWMSLIGIAGGIIPPTVFILLSSAMTSQQIGLGFGLLFSFQFAGNLLGSYIVGLSKDLTGTYLGCFLLMATFSIILAINAVVLIIKRKQHPDNI